MVKRFLTYSLEREVKICVLLMQENEMKKTNLRVTAIDGDGQGFTALLLCPQVWRSLQAVKWKPH